MHGRWGECGAVEALLEATDDGQSGVLVVEGEPGIGKTVLCQHAIEKATGSFTILRAQGRESEAEIPFAGLAELLGPIGSFLPDLPAPLGQALAGALALGPPVASQPFALGAATLSLLSEASRGRPLLAVVDDAHWLDAVSAQAISFAGRRLGSESVALVLSQRTEEGNPVTAEGFSRMLLGPLEPDPANALLADVAGDFVAPSVAKALVVATNGNPMALIEAAQGLTPSMLAGQEPLPDPLLLHGSIQAAFGRRLTRLRQPTRQALEVAAADDTGSLTIVMPALASLGLDLSSLEAAETANVIALTDRSVAFRHPLIRAFLYRSASPAHRRTAHRALAASAAATGDHERAAWHLASAAVGPDDKLATALEGSARRAYVLGGATAAAGTLERSATLTPSGPIGASRLVSAAEALLLAGRPAQVLAHLDEALRQTDDPRVRADAGRLRAQLATAMGDSDLAVQIITYEARLIAKSDREKASFMLAEATLPLLMDGRTGEALALASEAFDLVAPTGDIAHMLALNGLGHALLYRGEASRADDLLLQAYEQWRARGPGVALLVPSPASGLMCIERYALAREVAKDAIFEARRAGAPAALPFHLATLSQIDFVVGDWLAAYAAAAEASELAAETGQFHVLGFALACLANVEAGQGRAEACRRHGHEAVELYRQRKGGGRTLEIFVPGALALLELGCGRYEEAARILAPAASLAEEFEFREPGAIRFGADWVEANIGCGNLDEAERALESFSNDAEHSGRVWAKAAALRCQALLTTGPEAEPLFLAALCLHESTSTPFERARTELCYGDWLRHHGRSTEAQRLVRDSLAAFDRLDARPWSERARRELLAGGEAAPVSGVPLAAVLTAQELRVALAVAEGATNKEVAAALFLSPRTVEFHLGKVYLKLGIRSRSQLTRLRFAHGASDNSR